MSKLDELRIEIDKIDRELVNLFEKRMEVVTEVGKWKKENGIEIFDEKREEKVLEKVAGYLSEETRKDNLQKWFKLLMDISKEEQKLI